MSGFYVNSPFQLLACYGLLAAGLVLCLYLFVTVKAEMRALARRRMSDQDQIRILESALGEARIAVERLEGDLRDIEGQTGMLVAPPPAKSGLNLSRRTQVLRLHRAGSDSTTIAVSLGLPRSEVELLTKVHRLMLEQI